MRRPATKVVVFQCPQGTAAGRRWPRRLRPRRRVMLVLAPVSSMKTSRSGFSQVCQLRHSRRLAATSARSCSAARWLFFIAVAERLERGVDRLKRDPDTVLGQASLELGERDVRLPRHHLVQPLLAAPKKPLLLAADLAGRVATRLSPAPRQLDRARGTDIEAPRRLARRRPRLHGLDDTHTKIKRITIPHLEIPLSTNTISWDIAMESQSPNRINVELL